MIDKIFETHMKIISEDNNQFIGDFKNEILPLITEYSRLYENFNSIKLTLCEGANPEKLSYDQIESIFNTAMKMKIKGKMSDLKSNLLTKLASSMKKNSDVVEPQKIDKLANKIDNVLGGDDSKKVNYLASKAKKNKKISSLVASIFGAILSVSDKEKHQILNQGLGIVNDALNGKIDPTLDVDSISNIVYGNFGRSK